MKVIGTPRKRSNDMNATIKIAILAAGAIALAGCGSTTSATNASPAAVNTSSAAYKMGLKSGTTGMAEIDAFKGTGNNRACEKSFDLDHGASPDLNKQDYMAGCLYGLTHQSAQWTQSRK